MPVCCTHIIASDNKLKRITTFRHEDKKYAMKEISNLESSMAVAKQLSKQQLTEIGKHNSTESR